MDQRVASLTSMKGLEPSSLLVIPRDAICLDEEFKAVRIENSMQAP